MQIVLGTNWWIASLLDIVKRKTREKQLQPVSDQTQHSDQFGKQMKLKYSLENLRYHADRGDFEYMERQPALFCPPPPPPEFLEVDFRKNFILALLTSR